MLWKCGIGDWLLVFLPLLSTFGYIVLNAEERQSGQIKFLLIRMGNLRYCVSKVLSGALIGGFTFVAGYLIFGVFMLILFPSFGAFPADSQSIYMELYFGNTVFLYVLKRLTGVFLLGIFSSVFGIGVAMIFRDKYMLMCLPFLLNYIY